MKNFGAALLPLLGVLAAAPPGAPILPDGTYRYESRVAGNPVGSSTIVVRRRGGNVEIEESGALFNSGLVSTRELSAATFATTRYTATAHGERFTLTVAGATATLTSDGQTSKITAPPGAPLLVNDNMVAGFAQMPALLHATGSKKLTFACLCGEYLAVPVTVTAQTATTATISVLGQTGTLTFDPQSYVLQRFDLTAQQLSIVLSGYGTEPGALPSPAIATPVPMPPARYASRNVTIRADDGIALAATLTIPDAAPAKLPGFVFVHGSGCIDRDETIGPNKVFAQLANALSNDGYAVLRYDKRSCGKSGGTYPVRDRLIADARDAIAFLRAQTGIDPSRIFVLGHSEGGELAPSIAIADGRLRGIVLMAPPALPLEQIIMQQVLRQTPPADRAATEKREAAHLAAIASGKAKGPGNAWLRSSFGIDPAKVIASVPCPILIVQGAKDVQVLAADTPRLVNAARAAGRQVTVVMLPDDDHLFIKLAPGEASTGVEYFIPAALDPALLAAIQDWLSALR